MLSIEDLNKIKEVVSTSVEEKLDERLGAFEVRMDDKMDKRFGEFEVSIGDRMDKKLERMMYVISLKFADIEKDIESLQNEVYLLKKQVQMSL